MVGGEWLVDIANKTAHSDAALSIDASDGDPGDALNL
jgi:hypothetical protein